MTENIACFIVAFYMSFGAFGLIVNQIFSLTSENQEVDQNN